MMRSIFSKIVTSQVVVILLSTLTIMIMMSFLIRSHAIENKRKDLLQKGESAASLLTLAVDAGRFPSDETLKRIGELVGGNLWIIDKEGNVLSGHPPLGWPKRFRENQAKISSLFNGAPKSWVRIDRRHSDPSIVVAFPLSHIATPTVLFIDDPIQGVNETVDALDKLLFYSLLAGLLTAIISGLVISRSLTKPIGNISLAAQQFAKGNYASRTSAIGSDEIGSLGRTFNNMAQSLSHIEQNRRDFLANVTHELKTPVTSIQALSEAILDGLAVTVEQQRRYLTSIVQECRRINRLVQDLLDLAQLEAGELSIHPVPLDAALFIRQEAERFHALLLDKNLNLQISIPDSLPKIVADPDRLSQILSNLISNAVRYSPPSSTLYILAKLHGHHTAFSVQDEGSGIPPDALPYIWERFYRVDNSRSRVGGGTGLGLAITKKLIQTMGGEITVTSRLNQGTTFTFTLPNA
jgi:signal transduction histidine kinase